ncbi:SulP family inorganic anion transporter [Promicromonospora iranensis]|uniref:SulP family sulfate permease n=1 Tax=Promicromonospora iranensis TaxID=1105144 RepID=A0ABU2CTZ7_9MICO|nr:SulP family inorganic anion transporter [Promicromonospora iranensis]MDR7384810.1 SulP family sulfate permease [Promicromonospora iranensis]
MIASFRERVDIRDLVPSRADYDLRPRTLRSDLLAGITVGVVALPLALAFGVSSGVGPAAGLVTAVVAGIVAAVFGGSHVQVSGPTGAMAVVLAPIVAQHGVGSVALVTLLGGAIVLVCGLLRLGRVVTYVPWPVVEGFTLGIAAIIFLQQVPAAFGIAADTGHNTLVTAVRSVGAALWPSGAIVDGSVVDGVVHGSGTPLWVWTLAVVAVVAAVMLVLPRVASALPASLVAVALVTVLAEVLDAPVPRIGELPSSLAFPVLPDATPDAVRDLVGAAVAIAALAAIESLLSARVAAGMVAGRPGGRAGGRAGGPADGPVPDSGPYHPDRELVGQGLASLASGVFGGIPATGAIARTAVNVRSGARTRLSAVVHALVILAVIYLATGPVGRIPLAALAGVLMVTSFRMIGASTIRSVLTSTRPDALTFVVTAVITVAFDLIDAVQIGLLIAAFFALRAVAGATSVHREPLPGVAHEGDERIALFRLDGAMFFGASDRILGEVTALTDAGSGGVPDSRRDDLHEPVEVVILRLSHVQLVDATGARALADLVQELERRGVMVLVKGIQPKHRRLLEAVGLHRVLRHESHLFADLPAAVEHARSHVRQAQTA